MVIYGLAVSYHRLLQSEEVGHKHTFGVHMLPPCEMCVPYRQIRDMDEGPFDQVNEMSDNISFKMVRR